MIDKANEYHCPTLISIKSIVNKLTPPISMRSITAAIRHYCLEQKQTNSKDILLAFFLNCEKKLKKNTQQDWSKTIQQEIRKIVGFQQLAHLVTLHHYSAAFAQLKMANFHHDIESRLNQQLGEMQISEDVHLKTKYFFQWFQYLHQRREIKRYKNKEVEDLKKSRVFCHYSLKFHSFVHWKQHVKRAKAERQRAMQISLSASKRLARGIFTFFKEKIDIIKIEQQLEEAVRQKIQQLAVRSVFQRLRGNRRREEGKEQALLRPANIWVYRFYKFITYRISPISNRSSLLNRKAMQQSYEKLSLQLCWKGLKRLTHQTNKKIVRIRALLKGKAAKELIKIKTGTKSIKAHLKQFAKFKRMLSLKEFIVNLQLGSQTLLKNSEKISQIELRQHQRFILSFFSTLKTKFTASKDTNLKNAIYSQQSSLLRKRRFFVVLTEHTNKKSEICMKLQKTMLLVAFHYFKFNHQQYGSHKAAVSTLRQQLSLKHKKYLLANSLKGLARYKKIKLNESSAIMTIFKTLQQKKLSEAFLFLKERNEYSYKLQRLISKSQYILVKASFVTIMNRMLSNKIKIKQFYNQQEIKLKNILFQLLRRNKLFVGERKREVQQIALRYAKRRMVYQLKQQLQYKNSQNELEKLRQRIDKKHFFSCVLQQSTVCQELQAKQQAATNMLLASKYYEFSLSASEFIDYRRQQERLIYKLQKVLVQGVFKVFRKNVGRKREACSNREELAKQHQAKIQQINNALARASLMSLLRSNSAALTQKSKQIQCARMSNAFSLLITHKSVSILKKSLKRTYKQQMLHLLKTQLALKKSTSKCFKVISKSKLKESICSMQQNTAFLLQSRLAKSMELEEWLYTRRVYTYQTDFFTKLRSLSDLKENTLCLANVILRQKFQQLLKCHLNKRSREIKELVALRLYACNLKRRGMRGLRKASDAQILKQNRTRIEYNSKLSMQRSMEHVRKKSKLLETIERYNQSRISRVVR